MDALRWAVEAENLRWTPPAPVRMMIGRRRKRTKVGDDQEGHERRLVFVDEGEQPGKRDPNFVSLYLPSCPT